MNHFLSSLGILVTFGLALDGSNLLVIAIDQTQSGSLQARLLDKCCQVGREKASESAKFNCKLGAREALIASSLDGKSSSLNKNSAHLLALSADVLLAGDQNFADQCEMVLESCCLALHRTRNCDSGKQFAKSGTSCLDVELSKEATIATESFNDCCMSCSLGILAARTPAQNDTALRTDDRCKLISPLASSLSGQLYEQTYAECCQENLPRPSSALHEPGAPIDCSQASACSQRCLASGSLDPITRRPIEQDRCDCFTGFKLSSDQVTCVDIDECKTNLHTCNRQSEICDNTRGSFRCLARLIQQQKPAAAQQQHHQFNNFHQNSLHHSHHHHHQQQQITKPNNQVEYLNNDQASNVEPIERPFASLRLRTLNQVRW